MDKSLENSNGMGLESLVIVNLFTKRVASNLRSLEEIPFLEKFSNIFFIVLLKIGSYFLMSRL